MEKRSIRTARGDINRSIKVANSKLRQLKGQINNAKNELYELPLVGVTDMFNAITSNNLNVFKSNWKKIKDLQEAAHLLNYITNLNIKSMDDVITRTETMYDEALSLITDVKKVDRRMENLTIHIFQFNICKKHFPLIKEYGRLQGRKQKVFYELHKVEIDEFNAANQYISKIMNGKGKPPIKAWEKELHELFINRWNLCDKYYVLRKEIKTVENIKRGVSKHFSDIVPENQKTQHLKLIPPHEKSIRGRLATAKVEASRYNVERKRSRKPSELEIDL
jgi:hypothetical protein